MPPKNHIRKSGTSTEQLEEEVKSDMIQFQKSEIKFPLKFQLLKHKHQLKVISLNILAQGLIDGQCPAYRFINDPKDTSKLNKELFELRKQWFVQFLSNCSVKDFDILNLQEVGPLDTNLVNFVVQDYLNGMLGGNYGLELAQGNGGTQKLRCATIFNKSTVIWKDTVGLFTEKEGKITQFGLCQLFEACWGRQNFYNCTFHLAGGKEVKDIQIRQTQLEVLSNAVFIKDKIPTLISGDFNTEIYEELDPYFKENFPQFTLHFSQESIYNTENRIQYRFRSGWHGLQVVERTVDAIYQKGMSFEDTLVPVPDFNKIVNKEELKKIKEQIQDCSKLEEKEKSEAQQKLTEKLRECEEDIGFPSNKWFSDHLPVGAIVSFSG